MAIIVLCGKGNFPRDYPLTSFESLSIFTDQGQNQNKF